MPAIGAAVLCGALAGGCGVKLVRLDTLLAPPCTAASGAVRWVGVAAADRRGPFSEWCRSVGPPVVRAPVTDATAAASRSKSGLVVVSWNVHEGAGDIVRVVNMLRPADVVVLVQEAMRGGEAVPESFPPALRVPNGETRGRSSTPDIVDVADALGLWLAYVPSMRNGPLAREDRGCAILSTLPLADPIAIELPWVRQRRVAVMATVGGRTGGRPMSVVSAHLDNRPGRRTQSAALAAWLSERIEPGTPLIVGADLNTWFGAREDTVRQIDRIVPLVDGCDQRPTFRFRRRLDYLFASVPRIAGCEVGASTYGSDHHPLVMTIEDW